MRCLAVCSLGLALLLGLTGCRSSRNNLVESQLRAREDDVRTLRDELDRAEFLSQALSRELCAVRGIPGPSGVIEKPSEPYPIRSLRLGRGTSGRAADCGGDDALQVQVEPIDCEGQTMKAPGCLYVEVMEVSKEGLKRLLSAWEVNQDELRRSYRNGLFTTGYVLTFPWKTPPSTDKLRVLARFKLIDGRIFEADKDITVRLLPEPIRHALPAPVPMPVPTTNTPPMPTTPTPTLPPPSEVKPTKPPVPVGPILTSGKAKSHGVELGRPRPWPVD